MKVDIFISLTNGFVANAGTMLLSAVFVLGMFGGRFALIPKSSD